jgi:hypothetical protein
MGVRNCEELGINLQKIVSRLLANDDLVKLLYNTDENPLAQPALSKEDKNKVIFEKLIKTVPRVGTKDTANSVVVVYIQKAGRISGNKEFKNVRILVDVIVPLTQWYIINDNLRPFAILGQIQKSLDDKTINGLGKISGGDFELNFVTDDVICYQQVFEITEYA